MDYAINEKKSPLVLIVDDDATVRILMRHTLKKEGFKVVESHDGQPAIEFFKSHRPDIVLLDVMMPSMDGFTVCTIMRQLPQAKHIPILMVTGLDDTESINRAYEAGATDFITKPISYPLLGYRVRYALRSSQAIEQLGKSESRLAHAQTVAHLGNWEWDVLSGDMYWSDEVYRILGMNPHSTPASYAVFMSLVHPADAEIVNQHLGKVLHEGIAKGTDYRILLSNGIEKIVHSYNEPICNESGQTISINGTLQDITERKRVENELIQYRLHLEELVEKRTTELKEANIHLLEAKEQAEKANALKDKFISLVAHDLRSPLAGIISALEYMYSDSEPPLNEEHQEIVERLLRVGKSLVNMIEDVLNISRLKTGKLAPKQKWINVQQSVLTVFSNLGYLAKQKGVELINDIPANLYLFADPALIGEVFQNLTSNAIKFCHRGNQVRFFTSSNQPSVIIVQDTGVGIKAENLSKLFAIEEKISTPGTAGEVGTGFGLPFSQDIMRAHGGHLSVESTVGVGTTFFIHLPKLTHDARNTIE